MFRLCYLDDLVELQLQDLATTMLELWNLMDTPIEEQQAFQNVTCNIAASESEIIDANMLSSDFINYVSLSTALYACNSLETCPDTIIHERIAG